MAGFHSRCNLNWCFETLPKFSLYWSLSLKIKVVNGSRIQGSSSFKNRKTRDMHGNNHGLEVASIFSIRIKRIWGCDSGNYDMSRQEIFNSYNEGGKMRPSSAEVGTLSSKSHKVHNVSSAKTHFGLNITMNSIMTFKYYIFFK